MDEPAEVDHSTDPRYLAMQEQAQKAKVARAKGSMSFSRLSVYNDCGEKFRLYYVEEMPRMPSGFFLGGSAVHDTIEKSEEESWWPDTNNFRKGGPGFKHFIDLFNHKVSEAGGPDAIRWGGRGGGENDLWWLAMGPMMLRRYADTRQTDDRLGYKVTEGGIELIVNPVLPTGTPLNTRIDAFLMVDPDGERIIRDWKTGRTGNSDPIQLAVYAWAINQQFGTAVSRAEFVYLRSQDAEKRKGDLDVTDLMPLVPEMFAQVERQIGDEFFPLRPSFFCKSCAVREHCPYGKTIQ